MEEGRFDGLFMSIVQQNQGINGFFNEVFGFLRRKTDFFSNQKAAEQIIVSECKKNYDKFQEDKKGQEEEQKEKEKREQERKKKEQEKQKQEQQKAPELKTVPVQPPKQEKVVEKKQTEQPEGTVKKEGEEEDDNEPAPIGNGGSTDRYVWTQTLEEAQMQIPIDSSITGKQCKVVVTSKHLKVTIKNEVYIDQDFPEAINNDDSLWTIETSGNQKYISLVIPKYANTWHWWECVLEGDPKINTKKINPEPSKLQDLDGETRGTVEKMMFDMRQKQQGLPSSDDLKKQEMMDKFMKQHPEMDFSKCKFN